MGHNNHYFIQEYVNADFYRYFTLEQVENMPYFLRVTMYTKVSPEAHAKRCREVYRSLQMLKTFVSLQDRPGQLSVQMSQSSQNTLLATVGANTALDNFVADESSSASAQGQDVRSTASRAVKKEEALI